MEEEVIRVMHKLFVQAIKENKDCTDVQFDWMGHTFNAHVSFDVDVIREISKEHKE